MSDSDSTSYSYDEEAAGRADNVANRIDTSDAYIGRFKSVNAMKSERTGTKGVHFEFEAPGGAVTNFDLWTEKDDADKTKLFGYSQLMAIMAIMGLKGLKSVKGKYDGFVDGKRAEVEGEVFPELTNKDIGLVLQKELFTKQDGKESYRMNLFGIFHPTSRLTSTEIKEGKRTPEKLEKMLRGLKTKDSRTAVAAEPSQPNVGAPSGTY